jgi:Ca2+-transporting ATPase
VEGLGQPPVGVTGLSQVTVDERLMLDGPNRIVPESRKGRFARWLGPFKDPMVALLLIAAPTYLFVGDMTDAVATLIALIPVAAIGWLLQGRAERALRRLRELTAPTATVWRDGEHRIVPAEGLVVGDVCWLHEGDVIPADARVIDSTQLSVDESALTGESMPVSKTLSDGDSGVWAGTTVVAGRAIVEIQATGPRTRYGRIGALLAASRAPKTPLQLAMGRLVAVLLAVAGVFCIAVMATLLLHGHSWEEAIIAGVSLAFSAIPEEFSIVYTLYLSRGAWRLARDNALVRNLPGVEALGSTTVICTDKTGTLTEGKVEVAGIATASDGIAADIELLDEAGKELLTAAVLASEPNPFDPLDRAIEEHARLCGIDVAALQTGELVADWPFDPVDKYVTHLWQLPDRSFRIAAKGALEGVLAHAQASDEAKVALHQAHATFAERGNRVIAIAAAASMGPANDRAIDEAPLRILGLVAFHDPVREGVLAALATCRAAGIRVIMITGDHPATAHAIAEDLGLPHTDRGGDVIATGDQLDAADPAELDRLAAVANVFARTRPEQKYLLVQALRRRGEVVAMTGDGINDAPALRAADIGVAMGKRGTAVARDAATIVLLDDNFATIVSATRDGRRIYENLTRAFAYLIAVHVPLLLAALVIPLADKPLLLLPIQFVILEVLLHPIVSLVFEAEPAGDDVMTRPPRSAKYALSRTALWRPLAIGLILAIGVVGLYLLALGWGWPTAQARALGFTALLLAQPPLLLVERRPETSIWRVPLSPTRELLGAFVAIALTVGAVLFVAPIAKIVQLQPFPAIGWLWIVAVVSAATLWSEPLKRHRS